MSSRTSEIAANAEAAPLTAEETAPAPAGLIGAGWMGWRLRLLALAALAGCMLALILANWVAEQPRIDARWRADAASQLELLSSGNPALKPFIGRRLSAIQTPTDLIVFSDASALQATPRWAIDDAARAALQTTHDRLYRAFSEDELTLRFENGQTVQVAPQAIGIGSLPISFWLACIAVMLMCLVAVVVVLANPQPHTLFYALVAVCQAANMGFLAVETALQWGFPPILSQIDAPWRSAFDLISAAAVVHATSLHPRRLPNTRWIASTAWAVTLLICLAMLVGVLPGAWWWTQVGVALLGGAALLLLTWSHRIEAHPYAVLLRTIGAMALAAWLMLGGFAVLANSLPKLQVHFQAIGPMLWSMVFISLLLLIPFLAHSRAALREFALVAGLSIFAAIFDLMLVAFFAFGPLGSVTLTFFVTMGLYASARHWLLNRLLGQRRLSTEGMFDQLYRIAREVEAHPERAPPLLMRLLQDLFEPLEASTVASEADETAVVKAGGSAMLVPANLADTDDELPGTAILMRFARRGRRLFTAQDARLAERIVEQLRRAIAFDRAVEHGRVEERHRLAQDLHDDIGARLLTLMYQSPTPEMEDYVRHTLQDLKTLTRGLSTDDHRLSHAAAEWKADLNQRLSAAGLNMRWQCDYDRDVTLNVVQWSALTRILRELVSNAIAHAHASSVDVSLQLSYGQLELRVHDDGAGRDPETWAHGLGLGGVRKRAKQLGGQVTWLQMRPRGICCVVKIDDFDVQ